MATTRIISMHINKGRSIAQCLKARIDYVKNPDKTEVGEYVSSYACNPESADQEFLLSRNAYMANTGRHIPNEVIAYQLRQSFKPGEVTAEEANKIGNELAERLLEGNYAFIVATHTDREHIHNHIVFSSVSLDCTHKFKDIYRSGKYVAELSDQICKEHMLSVVQKPQDKTVSYDKWLGEKGQITNRDTLRMIIDSALRMQPDGFDALMQLLEDAGCWIRRGAHVSIKPPFGQRYIRLDSLGSEYEESVLKASLAGNHVHIPRIPRGKYTEKHIALLVDIEAKMKSGKTRGYQVWAERHNIDVISKSMIYLKENHIGSYEELNDLIQSKTQSRNDLKDRMKQTQNLMREISEQKKAITTYRRTKDVYTQYQESGWSQAFFNEHSKEIEAHKRAQEVYTRAGGKLPTLGELSAEYEHLLALKREDSAEWKTVKSELSDLWHIKTNMDLITADEQPEKQKEQRTKRTIR